MDSTENDVLQQSAMQRALQKRMDDPAYLIHQGLQHADNPDLAIDYETRMAAIEPLLQAKIYGQGGMPPSSQGQVTKNGAAGGAGINTVMSGINTYSNLSKLGILNSGGAAAEEGVLSAGGESAMAAAAFLA